MADGCLTPEYTDGQCHCAFCDPERARSDRIETYYHQSAWDLAERIVDLEDELGADVDGICTGMHADVAEAHAEIDRLAKELKEAKADSSYFEEWATANGHRLNATLAERDRFESAWKSARRRASRAMGAWRYMRWREDAQSEEMVRQDEYARWLWDRFVESGREADRYRLAWLSARQRAADEHNFGVEALDRKQREADRWRSGHETAEAQLVHAHRENDRLRALVNDLRKSTSGARLEEVGTEEDGGTVWRLASPPRKVPDAGYDIRRVFPHYIGVRPRGRTRHAHTTTERHSHVANNLKSIWDADPDAAPKERTSFSDDIVGRFRSGRQIEVDGKMIPDSLNEWRVTTGDPTVAATIAELLGGEVESWETDKEDNLQVLTSAPTVRIVIEPDGVDASFKQFIPGQGLTHHCDGFTFLSPEEDKGTPCKCPQFIAERKLAGEKGRGPKPSIDIKFRLEGAPDAGIFRFNTASWKLVEALGPLFRDLDAHGNTSDEESGASGQPVRATLTIENVTFTPQKGPKAGQEISYNKPVVKILGAATSAGSADLSKAA